ncbi:Wzz/FepE/Etk N-terminal domain-containing protein, partial [Thiolapillus sp.]
MKENQPVPVYPVQYIPNTEEEISLVDIWLTFRKHRKLFFKVAIGVTLLGLIVALFLPKTYDLRTSIEIGTAVRGDTPTPIEAPETVKAKLENSLIPMVIHKLTSNEEDNSIEYKISTTIPKKSALIVLTSKTTTDEEAQYKKLHNMVVEALTQDHARIINVLKKNIQTELSLARILLDELIDPATLAALIKEQEKALEEARADLEALSKPEIFGVQVKAAENKIQGEKNKLASLKDQAVILNDKLQKIAANQELIKGQVQELETQIKESMNLQKSAAQNVKNETQAMAQLMIDSEVQQNRKWLAKLKERLFITLENDKAEIQKKLEDNKRAQELQQEHIAQAEADLKKLTSSNELDQNKLKAIVAESEANITKLANDQKRKIAEQQETIGELQGKLDNFVETRAVVEPLLSTKPTSTPKRVILLIAIFLGGILGILAVFFAELREKVNKSLLENSSSN